jgi:membrane protease YdiL (CAAX protease family)
MVAFLLPAVMAAVILFAQHAAGVGTVTRFPVIVKGHPVSNLILGTLDYLPVASTVPLALFLLARTGQPPSALGIAIPSFSRDILPGLGLAAASFGTELLLLLPFAPLLMNSKLVNQVPVGHVPGYYVIWGIAISATTAVTEEVLVNGYLLTRLEQLGWSPRRALVLSLVLRTSYHVYYGLGFLLTVPFGYFVTRSFQKHRRLNRPIAAHFLFDAILTTIAILG